MHLLSTGTAHPEASFSARAGLKLPLHGVPAGTSSPLTRVIDKDRDFVALLRGYKQTGGLARGDEVAAMLQRISGQSVSLLARWIVSREALSFEWRAEIWVPLFQFRLDDMSIKEDFRRVSVELEPAFDGWTLSHWFVQPNSWLDGRAPADVLAQDPRGVWQAARADRFVAMG